MSEKTDPTAGEPGRADGCPCGDARLHGPHDEPLPAEPNAGDVEALMAVIHALEAVAADPSVREYAEAVLPVLDAVRRKAGDDRAEQIAQAIQAAKPPHITRDYTPVDAAYDAAARIARESR